MSRDADSAANGPPRLGGCVNLRRLKLTSCLADRHGCRTRDRRMTTYPDIAVLGMVGNLHGPTEGLHDASAWAATFPSDHIVLCGAYNLYGVFVTRRDDSLPVPRGQAAGARLASRYSAVDRPRGVSEQTTCRHPDAEDAVPSHRQTADPSARGRPRSMVCSWLVGEQASCGRLWRASCAGDSVGRNPDVPACQLLRACLRFQQHCRRSRPFESLREPSCESLRE
ncbi:hypothetical protein SAMN05192571_103327 [Pleomorphomonas diazotrophica]|nr:hypothetical protein SAMN05192571_103327 [Pleomorphomonas diazotrophica]